VKCTDVHLSLGAEPGVTSPELEAHLRECASCTEFRREMQRLTDKIRRALMINLESIQSDAGSGVTPIQAARVQQAPAGLSRRKHFALAASVLLSVAAVLVVWGALPGHSLAADVVSHVVSETIEQPLDSAVDPAEVKAVMERSGLQLDRINPSIVFIRTCFIRGRLVPHFIVRTEHGTATVVLMPDEHVKAPEPFEGSGYTGLLIPDGAKGSIAVLSRTDFDPKHYAGEIRNAVHFLPEKS
jgi:hypothetical protein